MRTSTIIKWTSLPVICLITIGVPNRAAAQQNSPMKLTPVEIEDIAPSAPILQAPQQTPAQTPIQEPEAAPEQTDVPPPQTFTPDEPSLLLEEVEVSEIQELGTPMAPPNIFDSLPSPNQAAPPQAAPGQSSNIADVALMTPRQQQIAILNQPLSQSRIDGLVIPLHVPRQSFTTEPPRTITASAVSDLDSLVVTTTYCRRRLYFEDATLERCGYSDWVTSVGILTNVHSAAEFMVDTALLPYRMIRQRPDELVSSQAK